MTDKDKKYKELIDMKNPDTSFCPRYIDAHRRS